jgi:hypothetical protein
MSWFDGRRPNIFITTRLPGIILRNDGFFYVRPLLSQLIRKKRMAAISASLIMHENQHAGRLVFT